MREDMINSIYSMQDQMNKAGDSGPTDLLETPISLGVYISNYFVPCSHS